MNFGTIRERSKKDHALGRGWRKGGGGERRNVEEGRGEGGRRKVEGEGEVEDGVGRCPSTALLTDAEVGVLSEMNSIT